MNKLTKIAAASFVALGLGMVAQAQAAPFIIDDFNLTAPVNSADDLTVNATGSTQLAQNGNGSTFMNQLNGGGNWDRNYYAFLSAGDGVHTVACATCDQGHFINDANSRGYGGFYYTPIGGATANIGNAGDMVSFQFATDVPGADVIMAFYNSGGLISTMHWSDLPDTNVALQTASMALPGGDYSAVNFVAFHMYSIDGADPQGFGYNLGATATSLDFNVDNITVPEPATLALMGLGLAGLGWSQRRRTA